MVFYKSAKRFFHKMNQYQSWPFNARDRARAPPHAPCFVEVRDKYAPSKMFTLIRAPGNRTVCKKGRTYFSIIQLNKVIKVIERSNYDVCLKKKH